MISTNFDVRTLNIYLILKNFYFEELLLWSKKG